MMNRIQTRVSRLFESIQGTDRLLKDGQVSIESASDDIKSESWKIISLYDDGIERSKKFLDDYFSKNDLNDKPNLAVSGKTIQYVTNKTTDFVEPNDSYRITPDEKANLRQPLIYSYSQLFKERPSLNAFRDTKDHVFDAILQPKLIASNLATGEPFQTLPNFLTGQKPVHRLRHILATLKASKEAIAKQSAAYNDFFPIILNSLENNETFIDGKIGLDTNAIRLNGALLNFNMTQAISATWGLHNPSANFDTMVTNLQMVIEDIMTEFKTSGNDEPALRFQFLIKNLAKEDLTDVIVDIYRVIREINDIVPRISKQLDEYQERLTNIPSSLTPESQHIAIVLSKLLTYYSAAIFHVYTMSMNIITNIDAMYLSVNNLTQRVTNYGNALDSYISQRSKR